PTDEEAEIFNCHFIGKCQLGSGKKTNRNVIIFRCREPTCAGTEVTCGKFVTDLCRPRPDVLKAVVAHSGTPLLEALSPAKNISALVAQPYHKFFQNIAGCYQSLIRIANFMVCLNPTGKTSLFRIQHLLLSW